MRLVAWLVLILATGCVPSLNSTPNSYEQKVGKLPDKWETPALYVRLPAEAKEGDLSIEFAKKLCQEFAIRIYDVFDGQVYVPEFIIINPSLAKENASGMCNLFNFGDIFRKNEAYVGSPPLKPGYFYCQIPTGFGKDEISHRAGTMLHEWLHAHIGLGDEYKHKGDPGSDMNTSCPLNPNSERNLDDNCCIMYLSRSRRELCRPGNHNPDTDQGKESCYSYAARVLLENKLALITVPNKTVKGPTNPPTPRITLRLK